MEKGEKNRVEEKCCEGAVTAVAYFLWPISHGKSKFAALFPFLISVSPQTKTNRNPFVSLFNRATTAGQKLW